MADVLVVTSKVKAMVKAAEMRTSADFIDALSAQVEKLVKAAVSAAKADKRATLKPADLPKAHDPLTVVP